MGANALGNAEIAVRVEMSCLEPGETQDSSGVGPQYPEGEAMTKADLVEEVHEAIGPGVTKKDCAAVVDAFLNAIKRAIADGEHIEIRGFGTFKVRERRTRMARNPRTGEPVRVPARAVPVFKPSKLFKEDVDDNIDVAEELKHKPGNEDTDQDQDEPYKAYGTWS